MIARWPQILRENLGAVHDRADLTGKIKTQERRIPFASVQIVHSVGEDLQTTTAEGEELERLLTA